MRLRLEQLFLKKIKSAKAPNQIGLVAFVFLDLTIAVTSRTYGAAFRSHTGRWAPLPVEGTR